MKHVVNGFIISLIIIYISPKIHPIHLEAAVELNKNVQQFV